MVTSFEVSVPLNIPRDVLWRVRATKAFMKFLVSNGALNRMDSTSAKPSTTTTPSARVRTQTYVPANMAIPDMIKPVFDETYIEIKDIQTWDDDIPYVQQSTIVPGIMADLVQSRAQLTLEQMEGGEKDGEGCMHKLSGECNVGIPFLGYYVEQAIIANMKEFYAGYARHIDGFVDMVVRRFGDGSMASLRMAVDRLVAEEKG